MARQITRGCAGFSESESAGSLWRMSEWRFPGELRHYLPLFFLAPSMGMLLYAWNKPPPPPPRVIVTIRATEFECPGDVQLRARATEKDRPEALIAVTSGVAAIPFGAAGPVTIQLVVELGTTRSEPVGQPREFVFPAEPTETRWRMEPTKAECQAALKKLRAVR